MYKIEELDSEEDNGTMVENVDRVRDEVVGHKIVSAGIEEVTSRWGVAHAFVITLDNGKKVKLEGSDDCCAFTELETFFLHVDKIDHVITGVGTTDGYHRWHIYADMGDVLELTVNWSCGNPFYYAYGFYITVEDM